MVVIDAKQEQLQKFILIIPATSIMLHFLTSSILCNQSTGGDECTALQFIPFNENDISVVISTPDYFLIGDPYNITAKVSHVGQYDES